MGGAVAATRCCQACDPDHDQESLDMDTSTEEFAARPWNDETLIKEGTGIALGMYCIRVCHSLPLPSVQVERWASFLFSELVGPGLKQDQSLLDMLQGQWYRKEDGQPVGQISGAPSLKSHTSLIFFVKD